jgi:hypothetical protein
MKKADPEDPLAIFDVWVDSSFKLMEEKKYYIQMVSKGNAKHIVEFKVQTPINFECPSIYYEDKNMFPIKLQL